MSKATITEGLLTNIANAIRTKLGVSTTYTPAEMATAIGTISGYPEPTGSVNITQNGTANVKDYASANVSVPNSYSQSDEGKVVSNGALVAQTAHATVTENGTIDTTLNNSVTVNVSGGGGNSVIEEWDFTSVTPTIGTIRGAQIVGIGSNCSFDSGGVHLNNDSNANLIFRSPVAFNGVTVEIDVASMQLTSGVHRRFIMADASNGLIYRSTGVWAFYNSSWLDSNEHDGDFFSGSTVKVHVDSEGYWHIYKNGVLWWEPSIACSLQDALNATTIRRWQFCIGASSNGLINTVITGMRAY